MNNFTAEQQAQILTANTVNGVINLPKRKPSGTDDPEYDFLRSHLYQKVATVQLKFIYSDKKKTYYVVDTTIVDVLAAKKIKNVTVEKVRGVGAICSYVLNKPDTFENKSLITLGDDNQPTLGGTLNKVEILEVKIAHTSSDGNITNNVGDFIGNPDSRNQGDKLEKLAEALAKKQEQVKLETVFDTLIDKASDAAIKAGENAKTTEEIKEAFEMLNQIETAKVARVQRRKAVI